MFSLAQRCAMECIGTFILMFLGLAPPSKRILDGADDDDLWTTFAWFVSVTMAVIVSDKISGAHLNPSVSLSFYISTKLNWITNAEKNGFWFIDLITYSVAQTIGAFLAAALLFMFYIYHFDDEHSGATIENAVVFVTFPNDHIHRNWQAFLVEIVGTGLLILMIYCFIEKTNEYASSTVVKAICIGLFVFSLIQSFSGIAGPSLNPARDFGPRLFLAMTRWGSSVFTAYGYYFWIPVVGPLMGSALGTVVYHKCLKGMMRTLQEAEETMLIKRHTLKYHVQETANEQVLKRPYALNESMVGAHCNSAS